MVSRKVLPSFLCFDLLATCPTWNIRDILYKPGVGTHELNPKMASQSPEYRYLAYRWEAISCVCHDFYRSRCLSLFGRCSAVNVTGLLAIIDPFFIFHWFCLVFPHTCFQLNSLPVVSLTLCLPSCLCQRLFCQCSFMLYRCASGPRTHVCLCLYLFLCYGACYVVNY